MDWFVVSIAAVSVAFIAWHLVSVVRREKRREAGLPDEPLGKKWISDDWVGGFGFGLAAANLPAMLERDGFVPFLVTISIAVALRLYVYLRIKALERREQAR